MARGTHTLNISPARSTCKRVEKVTYVSNWSGTMTIDICTFNSAVVLNSTCFLFRLLLAPAIRLFWLFVHSGVKLLGVILIFSGTSPVLLELVYLQYLSYWKETDMSRFNNKMAKISIAADLDWCHSLNRFPKPPLSGWTLSSNNWYSSGR
jgi:hypothetical protein